MRWHGVPTKLERIVDKCIDHAIRALLDDFPETLRDTKKIVLLMDLLEVE